MVLKDKKHRSIEQSTGEPSRYQRSKTWRSPYHHRYIKNTSTCGTTPTEHLLNAGRRPQTSQKARKSPCNWVGQKKKEKKEEIKESGWDLCLWEGAEKEEKFLHIRKPLHWGGWGQSFRASEESAATGVQKAKWRDSHTEDRCQPALPSLRCLSARWGGWGLDAEARASEVRPQGEDWGWLHEDSLKGLVHHSWGSLGRSLGLPERQGTIVGGCARRGVGPP